MMSFRDLVAFGERLQTVSSVGTHQTVLTDLIGILLVAQNCSGAVNVEPLQIKYQQILSGLVDFESTLDQLKQQVKTRIAQEEVAWYQRSADWYQDTLNGRWSQHEEFPAQYRNLPTKIKPETEQLYISRIIKNTDWRYPAMIIHPGTEPFMQHMVASDPLYLIDESQALLDLVDLSSYNTQYQRRLRRYTIEESFDRPILSQLPDEQFNLCLAYHYFDFRPANMIEKYLAEIYQKLRPGGVLIMTVNDCERAAGVDLAEKNYACYNKATDIQRQATQANYQVEFFHCEPNQARTWIELRKPGQLTTLRGGQTLARIIPNPVANSK